MSLMFRIMLHFSEGQRVSSYFSLYRNSNNTNPNSNFLLDAKLSFIVSFQYSFKTALIVLVACTV